MEDVLTRVPLIARIPQVTDHNQGKTWKEPVQLFDIMPTVMEVAGIHVPHTHFAKSLVKPMMGTADPKTDGRKYVFAEGGFASYEPRDLESDCDAPHKPCTPLGSQYYPKLLQQQERPDSVARAIMGRSKTAKLIWRNDPKYGEKDCELYDLKTDSQELSNKWDSPEYAGVQAELKDALLHWLSQTSDVTPWEKDPRDSYPGVIQSPKAVWFNSQKGKPALKQKTTEKVTLKKGEKPRTLAMKQKVDSELESADHPTQAPGAILTPEEINEAIRKEQEHYSAQGAEYSKELAAEVEKQGAANAKLAEELSENAWKVAEENEAQRHILTMDNQKSEAYNKKAVGVDPKLAADGEKVYRSGERDYKKQMKEARKASRRKGIKFDEKHFESSYKLKEKKRWNPDASEEGEEQWR